MSQIADHPRRTLTARQQARIDRFFTSTTPTRRSLLWLSGQMLCRTVCVPMFSYKAYGVENVPPRGGVLLAANHQSYLDPVLVGVPMVRPVSYMANAYLFKNPLMAGLIRRLHAFPVQQGKGDRAAVNACIEKLKEGHVLCIFPEGHRSSDGELQPLQRGIALMARRAEVPVVPVAIDGAYDAWPRRSKFPRPRPIHLMYGKPIDVAGMDYQQILSRLETDLRALVAQLRLRRRESGWY